MKILHSADWHLDSAFVGRGADAVAALRRAQLRLPGLLAEKCRELGCDMVLLAGDLFDGSWSRDSVDVLRKALADMAVPVFISPGNHDFIAPDSPWLREIWPDNVHIFKENTMQSIAVPGLDCRVYGAGFAAMDCGPLMEDFAKEGNETFHIAVLHGDPAQKKSPYNPISQAQVAASGLDYMALGHVHKAGSFRAGETLCAWPGCPMGRGFDELEEKGFLLVTVEEQTTAQWIPLDTPRFYDLETEILTDPASAVASVLPAVGNDYYYRITLTGEWDNLDMARLSAAFDRFPNLELRDRTVPVTDLWACAGEDSLAGMYFGMLKAALAEAAEEEQQTLTLAAKISRRILDGREVELP